MSFRKPLLLILGALLSCTLPPASSAETVLALNSPVAVQSDPAVSPAPVEPSIDTIETQPPAPIREAMFVAPEPAAEDLWERIRDGYAMKELDSKLIKRHEKWYASHPDYVLRMTERARRYLHYIVEEVERRNMPMEIALLPMIESAFNPGANSVASASGIWQFIPSTGKHFGMEQNWWYDGRRD
ncbi:MAG: transglycosylase SLT domain-containing protein, partial [Pseudomonadota bacterium]